MDVQYAECATNVNDLYSKGEDWYNVSHTRGRLRTTN